MYLLIWGVVYFMFGNNVFLYVILYVDLYLLIFNEEVLWKFDICVIIDDFFLSYMFLY